MSELFDDERNLLSTTPRPGASSMGQYEVLFTSTWGEGRENPLPLIFSGMIPGGQDKLEQEFLGRRLFGRWAQFRIDRSQSRVKVRRDGHRHRMTALMIGGAIAHNRQHVVKWQDTGGSGCSACLLRCAITRALLSASGFASTYHGV
jgi:hypothetical protein